MSNDSNYNFLYSCFDLKVLKRHLSNHERNEVKSMDSKEIICLEKELSGVVNKTTKLSFPFLSDKKVKEELIEKEKIKIDYLIDEILKNYNVIVDNAQLNRDKIWDSSKSVAMEKFTTLPVSLQLNSFFLQELMHEYAEKQVKTVLQIVGTKY